MPFLTDLADACRGSGLEVVEVDGWRTRGHGSMTGVETIVCHHTATPKSAAGDYPSLRIVRDGRSDLPGPLAQLGLGRSGTVYVIAAGVAWHAGDTFQREQDNWHAIGIEAEADGLSAWPEAQVDAYARLCAALCRHYNLIPARVQGHKEVASPLGRKIDPNFDMSAFRARVTGHIEGDPMADYEKQLDAILRQTQKNGRLTYQRDQKILDGLDSLAEAVESLASDAAKKEQVKRVRGDLARLRADIVAEKPDADE